MDSIMTLLWEAEDVLLSVVCLLANLPLVPHLRLIDARPEGAEEVLGVFLGN